MANNIRTTRGFTLVELLVVISIIGLLSSIVLATINSVQSRGRDAQRIADAGLIQAALELYYGTNRRYPDSLGEWKLSLAGNQWIPGLAPAFFAKVPIDPINTWSDTFEADYAYYTSANGADYCLQIIQEGDCSASPNYSGTWTGTCKLHYSSEPNWTIPGFLVGNGKCVPF